jgi:hypothetical protein
MIEKQERDAERTERLERCIPIIVVATFGIVTIAWMAFLFWLVSRLL